MPKVSIGLPVYNGERFIEAALVSMINQTFEDCEFIVSDNASTDRTEEICRDYASHDKRIRYVRNEVNRGAAFNYNQTFKLSSGEYFKWAACDDLCAPTYIEKCVSVLDQNPSVVLCFTWVRFIDESGAIIDDRGYSPRGQSLKAHERFIDLVAAMHIITEIFGLIRATCLKQTPLIAPYAASDRVLLGELALHGRFCEIPEYLFFHREHAESASTVYVTLHAYTKWFDPSLSDKLIFPTWRIFGENLRSIYRSPLTLVEKIRCYMWMVHWLRSYRLLLMKDVEIARRRLFNSTRWRPRNRLAG